MMEKRDCMEPSGARTMWTNASQGWRLHRLDSVGHINHGCRACEGSVQNNPQNCESLPWVAAREVKWFAQTKQIPWWSWLRMLRDFWPLSVFWRVWQCICSWWKKEKCGAYFKVDFRRVWRTNKGSIPLQKGTRISRELVWVEGTNIAN